jgi:hypothetical protein
VAGLSGCGGDHSSKRRAGPAPRVEIRHADCTDWNRAGSRERHDLITQLGNFAGGPVGTSTLHGPRLPERDAYRLFENYCKKDFASHFQLYRLYTRAAAFRRR